MATRVRRHRRIGFDDAPLDQAGTITPGTLTYERAYDYPVAADGALTDVPTYRTVTRRGRAWT